MKTVEIYTDGACSGNPGPGGWAAVMIFGDHQKEIAGYVARTTNNRMELTAVIQALQHLKEKCNVNLHTDSAYIVNAFEQRWIDNWIRNQWRTASRKPVENRDLWEQLIKLTNQHDVTWIKVKGHSTDKMNNRADQLAVEAYKNEGH